MTKELQERLREQSGWNERSPYMGKTAELLWDAIDELASLEARCASADTAAREGPIYLQTEDGWFAISLSAPKYCLRGNTLAHVKEIEQRAREFYERSRAAIKDKRGG